MMPEADHRQPVLAELAPRQLPLVERLEADLVVLGRRPGRWSTISAAADAVGRLLDVLGHRSTSVLDAGIDDAVGDVREQVREHDEHRGDQQDAHEDRVVELARRVDRELADARPREDRLGDDRAREQERDLEADVGDDRQQRVAQRVLEVDDARRAGPWPCAVRTKSWPSDSSMLARTNRLSPGDVDHDERDDRQDQVLADVADGRERVAGRSTPSTASVPNGGEARVSVIPLAGSHVRACRRR